VVAAGPIAEVLTDENLTATFNVPLKVQHAAQRWYAVLRVEGGRT